MPVGPRQTCSMEHGSHPLLQRPYCPFCHGVLLVNTSAGVEELDSETQYSLLQLPILVLAGLVGNDSVDMVACLLLHPCQPVLEELRYVRPSFHGIGPPMLGVPVDKNDEVLFATPWSHVIGHVGMHALQWPAVGCLWVLHARESGLRHLVLDAVHTGVVLLRQPVVNDHPPDCTCCLFQVPNIHMAHPPMPSPRGGHRLGVLDACSHHHSRHKGQRRHLRSSGR